MVAIVLKLMINVCLLWNDIQKITVNSNIYNSKIKHDAQPVHSYFGMGCLTNYLNDLTFAAFDSSARISDNPYSFIEIN